MPIDQRPNRWVLVWGADHGSPTSLQHIPSRSFIVGTQANPPAVDHGVIEAVDYVPVAGVDRRRLPEGLRPCRLRRAFGEQVGTLLNRGLERLGFAHKKSP